jgi:hypothetical protein
MKSYLVTWTYTVESDSADGAMETALDAMAEGNLSAEVEELIDEEAEAVAEDIRRTP